MISSLCKESYHLDTVYQMTIIDHEKWLKKLIQKKDNIAKERKGVLIWHMRICVGPSTSYTTGRVASQLTYGNGARFFVISYLATV